MAESEDALDLKSKDSNIVSVQVRLPAFWGFSKRVIIKRNLFSSLLFFNMVFFLNYNNIII